MARPSVKIGRLLAHACVTALAAVAWPRGAQAQQLTPPFQPQRYDEDWSNVDSAHAPFGAQWKDLPIASGVTLSLGGDARWRFANIGAPRLGINGEQGDSYILQRLLVHADLHFGDEARVFFQLGAHQAIGRTIVGASDNDRFDLQQAFIDLRHDFGGEHVMLRLGRQELVLGSPRWVGARDSSNIRERHDLALLQLSSENWRIDAFAGYPTRDTKGIFDDAPDRRQLFYGAQVQHNFGGIAANLYAFELDRDFATIAGQTARDDRLSRGGRVFGKAGAYDFDAELMLQSGRFGAEEIHSLGLAVDVGRTFGTMALKPRFGVRYTYGSGDKNLGDDRQNTFVPPSPQGSWFGQNGLSSFSNAAESALTLGLSPDDNVSVSFKLADVKRVRSADYLYANSTALAGTTGGSTAIGNLVSATLSWRVNPNATLGFYVSYLNASDALHAHGAKDVAYAHTSFAVRF